MKKKFINLVILCLLALLAGVYYYIHQPKNVFDEIYQETKKTYRSNNILGQIEDFEIRSSWPSDNKSNRCMPFGKYDGDSLPESYSEIKVNFNFQKDTQISSITFEKKIASKVRVRIWSKYSHTDSVLTKRVKISLENGGSNNYIENESKVKGYLKDYGITAADLDNYYDEIVNKKVLTDWCSIYESKFSPDNYGDVTIKTQWEGW